MFTSGELERASMAVDEPMKELESRIMTDIVRRIREKVSDRGGSRKR